MVQLMNSSKYPPPSESQCRPVKVEVEDALDDENGPYRKRSKLSSSFQQQWSMGANPLTIPPTQYNPLDEPSPLGLRLKKTPSFLDLIQMRLSQGCPSESSSGENVQSGKKKETKGSAAGSASDKLKASNFPASLIRIGTWECVSRYEGDLVAKCYFAKHKLVWEVLDGGLKSKMEIQWSDIMAIKANLPDNGLGTLDIVLTRQPLFFRETNPQPRKHTLWQATADFTGGQASINRRHFLQCPQGLLNKHFEKLIQCDPRLNWLNQQPEIVLESPYFEPKGSIFEDPNESKCHVLDQQMGEKSDCGSSLSGFRDTASPTAVQSSSSKSELWDPVGRASDNLSHRTPSPSSGMDLYTVEVNSSSKVTEAKMMSHVNQLKVPGIHASMSMSDLVNHIGNHLSEQMMSGNRLSEESETKVVLEDIAQYLLSDSQHGSSSDEKSLMSRVNSLCCLLQKDPAQNSLVNSESGFDKSDDVRFTKSEMDTKDGMEISASGGGCDDGAEYKQAPGMSRKDSLGDLLLHLPRITSLPQFLFNIPEDGENETR